MTAPGNADEAGLAAWLLLSNQIERFNFQIATKPGVQSAKVLSRIGVLGWQLWSLSCVTLSNHAICSITSRLLSADKLVCQKAAAGHISLSHFPEPAVAMEQTMMQHDGLNQYQELSTS